MGYSLVRSILTHDGHNKLRLFELDVKEKKKETIGGTWKLEAYSDPF